MRPDLPIIDGISAEYWEAAARGVLLLRHCQRCEKAFFYPRLRCPECWSDETDWVEATGRGTIYSFSIVRRQMLPPFCDRVPYVIAVVELDEGVRMSCNIVDCDPETVSVGVEVTVVFEQRDGFTLPQFKMASGLS